MSVYAPNEFNLDEKLYFSEPVKEEIELGKQKLTYYRLKMWDEKEENRINIQPQKLFSFGVNESKSEETGKISGYECSFVLIKKLNEHVNIQKDEDEQDIQPTWEELGADHIELQFLNFLDSMHRKVAEKLFSVKGKCGLGKIKSIEAMIDKLSPPWKFQNKKGTKEPDYTKSPVLRAKLIVGLKNGIKMYTRFYNEEDDKLDVMGYVGERFNAIPALAFESVYIGDAYVTFQIKLPEAVIYPVESSTSKRLLRGVTSNLKTLNITDDKDNEKDKKSETKSETKITEGSDTKSTTSPKSETKITEGSNTKSTTPKKTIKPLTKVNKEAVNKLLGTETEE